MNIYRVSQDVNVGYDTYDSMIVAASSEEEARNIHPESACGQIFGERDWWEEGWRSWCKTPEQAKVEFIGTAKEGTEAGMILASFNAG